MWHIVTVVYIYIYIPRNRNRGQGTQSGVVSNVSKFKEEVNQKVTRYFIRLNLK